MVFATNAVRPAETPAEPAPTSVEVLARARAIADTLVARQDETERRTFYAPDTHEELSRAGLYRILVPRRFGGLQLPVETFLRVCMALARGCPSTGWMYCFGAAHALAVASLFEESAQAEIFTGGDFICPVTIVPGGTLRPADDGGWLVDGTWKYCSGSPYATHFVGHSLVPDASGTPTPRMFIVGRDSWCRLDDWGHQLGLRGSGSHGIVVDSARVPAEFVLDLHLSETDVAAGTPGRRLHGPQYGGGPLSFMVLEVAALAVGMAQGALDVYEDLMRERSTLLPPIMPRADNQDYQSWYGEASAMIATAEAALLGATRQWSELCAEETGAFTRERDLHLTTVCRHVIDLCWRAVEGYLFPTAGSSAVREGERLERVWRDMSMLHTHAGFAVFLPTAAMRELARVRMAAR